MKKLVLEGPRKSKLIDVDEPKIGENELLVKIKYTGVCSSEMPPWAEGDMKQNFGHEPMGIVVDKGSAVKDFKIGDRVTGLGPGYQEYGVMLPENTCKIPDNVADEDAAAEPYGCLLSAVGKVPVKIPGDTVVVVGAGYMGLGAISLYKLFGAGRIIVVDPREEARANALKYGATEVYAPDALPADYKVNWDNWGQCDIFKTGFDKVLEFSGVESALQLAGEMVCAHGTLGVGGYHNENGHRDIDYKLWNVKAFTAINCHERRTAYQAMLCGRGLELLSKDLWNFKGMVTHIYAMDEFDKANEELIKKPNGYIKGLVKCEF